MNKTDAVFNRIIIEQLHCMYQVRFLVFANKKLPQ